MLILSKTKGWKAVMRMVAWPRTRMTCPPQIQSRRKRMNLQISRVMFSFRARLSTHKYQTAASCVPLFPAVFCDFTVQAHDWISEALFGAIGDSLSTNCKRGLRFWQMWRIHNLAHSNFTSAFAHRQPGGGSVCHYVATDGFFGVSIEH